MARDRNRKTEKQTQLRDQGENFQKAIITLREIQKYTINMKEEPDAMIKRKSKAKLFKIENMIGKTKNSILWTEGLYPPKTHRLKP